MADENTDLRCYLTNAGIAAENNSIQLNRSLNVVEMVFGSGLLPDASDPRAQTAMISEVYAVPCAMLFDAESPTLLVFKGDLPADVGGFHINEVGIRLEDGTIYGYARGKGDYKPTLEQGATDSVRYAVEMYTENADIVVAKIDLSTVYADWEDLDVAKKEAANALAESEEEHLDADDPHPQYLSKTSANQNKADRDAELMKLPIYPLILTTGNIFSFTQDTVAKTIVVDDEQVIRFRGWKDINTTNIDIAERTFAYDAAVTYHLRMTEEGKFKCIDVTDVEYNPDGLPEINNIFDGTYSDTLIAKLENGVLTPLINVPVIFIENDMTVDVTHHIV